MIIIAGCIDLADPDKMNQALERAKPLQQATRDDESLRYGPDRRL